MAAGLGCRMRPLTEKIPKPLVTVGGIPLIETMIQSLLKRGVKRIFVVVGYKKEMFVYLTEKYKGLTLVENREYKEKNNISSLYAVLDRIGDQNCFICEADIYVRNPSVFQQEFASSCYFGKMVPGYSDDWIFETSGGQITGIKRGGTNSYHMTGAAYLLRQDLQVLKREIQSIYPLPETGKLFWDEVMDRFLYRIKISVHEIAVNDLIEIDTLDELDKIRREVIGVKR